MRHDAETVEDYLAGLDEERRETVGNALTLVRRHIPEGFHEAIQYGMISWVIPLERYAYTYNGEPLSVVSLGSQKNHVALYMHGVYMDADATAALRRSYADAGARLDMGKSCLRFRRWQDVLPGAVGAALEAVSPERFIALYEQGQGPDRMEKHRKAAEKRAAKEKKKT